MGKMDDKTNDKMGDKVNLSAAKGNTYYDSGYEQGVNDAWKAIQELESTKRVMGGGPSAEDLVEMFGTCAIDEIVIHFSPSEVTAKITEWKEKENIRVGDIVKTQWSRGVVTCISKSNAYSVLSNDGMCNIFQRRNLTKTGEHLDVESWFNQIGGI